MKYVPTVRAHAAACVQGARAFAACLTAITAIAALPVVTSAQAESAAIEIDEAHPETSVPSPEAALKKPLQMSDLVMELSARAERAQGTGEFALAARYFRALSKAVPSRATAYSKACRAFDQAGDQENAVAMCRAALGKEGVTVDDSVYFVELVLKNQAALSSDLTADLDALLAHLEAQLHDDAAGKIMVYDLRCRVAAKLEDLTRLDACSAQMAALAPSDPRTFVYASIFALKKQDWARTAELIDEAKRADLPEGAIALMQQKLNAQRAAASLTAGPSRSGLVWFLVIASSLLAVIVTWIFQRRGVRRTV